MKNVSASISIFGSISHIRYIKAA